MSQTLIRKEQKIRVLFVVGKLSPGGLQTLMVDIFDNSDRTRFEFDFCEMADEHGSLVGGLEEQGAKVFLCSLRSNPLTFHRRMVKILAAGSYDAIHIAREYLGGFVAKAASQAGIPVRLLNYGGVIPFMSVFSPVGFRQRLGLYYARRYATVITGASEASLRHYHPDMDCDPERYKVIHNGIECDIFISASCQKAKLRNDLGFSDSDKLVGFCGRLEWVKDPAMYLEIASLLAARNKDMKFLIVGDGSLAGQVRSLIKDYGLSGRVICAGWSDSVYSLLAAMDIMLITSHWEGFCIAAVEAQAAGVVCVAPRLDCFKDSLVEDMHNNLFARDNTMEAVSVIESLFADPELMSRQVKQAQNFIPRFDIRQITKTFELLYEGGADA